MKKLLNTLYITSESAYLSLDGENVVVSLEGEDKKRFPLHMLEEIVSFSYKGASPALMGKCSELEIGLSFFSPNGKYLASVGSCVNGNVVLRHKQSRTADDENLSLQISKNIILGKLYNSKYVLLRTLRDHPLQVDSSRIMNSVYQITECMERTLSVESKDELRGIEGVAAAAYFDSFNEMILQNKAEFVFETRNRRPPTDRINALMSLTYTLLSNSYASALLSAGLDPYIGFMHGERPGRKSLALDMMEELRAVYADRFVLYLINNRIIVPEDFEIQENNAVILKEKAKKTFLAEWQNRKRDEITHPYLKEKIQWGLVPYSQAMLLARYLRDDIDQYPPFFWK